MVTLGPIFDFDTSGEFFDLVKTNPYAPRLATVRNVMALPGAVAFKSKNIIVGALGTAVLTLIASDAKIDACTEFQTGAISGENGGYMGNVG
jgi:hypothetical protein